MFLKSIKRSVASLLCVFALFPLMQISASAVAVTGVSGVEVTVDSNGSISESAGTVTATVKGSFTSSKTTTITVKNTSDSTAIISFKCTLSNCGANSIGGSGDYSFTLTHNATTTFTITSRSWTTSTTATAKLSNFKVEAVAAESNVTVTYGSLGSVKIDGAAVASGSVNKVSSATGGTFVAVPGSGAKFVGWIDPATNAVISTSATYPLVPTEDVAIRAVFASASTEPCFWAGGANGTDGTGYLFESFGTAISYASSASNKIIALASDGTLPAGTHTIPAGITLLIPFDAANTLCADKPNVHENAYTKPSVFRTLTLASGANITVNGAISVSGCLSSKYGHNGMPSGPLGFIEMKDDSKITVNSGANLYVWGYIKGSGSVEVNSGGTVYESFQIADYRGGDATSQIVGKADEYGVFPFNQYYVQNVEVPMTLHAGAVETGYGSVHVTLAGVQALDFPFIGASESMFIINDGYVVKDYVEGTGRTEIKIYGNMTVSEISMSMKVSLIGNITIDSSKYSLPVPNHMTLSLESGNLSLNQSMAFLPGSELYMKEGTTVTLGNGRKIYVYDLDQWLYNNGANGYSGTTNLPYMQLKYVPGGDGTEGRLKDALVQIDGTVDVSAGSAYVTSGGANVYSTGTGVVTVQSTTDAVAYQVITNGTDVGSWPSIAMQPAILKDGDGTDVTTKERAGTYTYYATTGKWCTPGHRYESSVTAPTCTEKGYTAHTCIACGHSYTDTEVAALGHTEVVDAAVAPTCTATGLTEGSHCQACGYIITEQEVVPAAHTEETVAGKAATCTETGLTEGKRCTVCGVTTVAQTEIAALGHKEETVAGKAATCTETGLTDGAVCTVCGVTTVAQETIDAFGHTAGAAATCTTPQTCTICGAELAAALGHSVSGAGGICDPCGKTVILCNGIYEEFTLAVSKWYIEHYTNPTVSTYVGFAADFTGSDALKAAQPQIGFYLTMKDTDGEVLKTDDVWGTFSQVFQCLAELPEGADTVTAQAALKVGNAEYKSNAVTLSSIADKIDYAQNVTYKNSEVIVN